MVGTTHPGNIGACARAMKNMGLSDLALVTPKIYPSEEATARAAGADDILAQAKVYDCLNDAIGDCHRVIGASARLRTIDWPQLNPKQCAELAWSDIKTHKTAILFGQERIGLTNEQLERCQYLMYIPCNEKFSSLNVAAAVQIVAYELFQAQSLSLPGKEVDWATAAENESFHEHLRQTLFDVGFLREDRNPPSLLRKLRRIFNRCGLEKTEIHMLRGILTSVQKQVQQKSC